MKRVLKFFNLWDGIWSIPLALLLFIAFGYLGEWYWGDGFGAMSPSFFHAAFFTALVIVALNFCAWLGIYFNFRAVFRYYLQQSGIDFKTLKQWQKIIIILFLYSLYFVSGIIVIASLV